jgi:hypothetical protein
LDLDITGGVQGLDYEKRLVQMILEGAPAIEKSKLPPSLEMGLIFGPSCKLQGPLDHLGDGVYMWTPN